MQRSIRPTSTGLASRAPRRCAVRRPRWAGNDAAIWQGLEDGFFNVFSSDHSPYRFDKSDKFPHGGAVPFNRISSGVPGIETRSPILFSEGVATGRIDINRSWR